MVDFFNRINLIYGTVNDWCSPASCPTMSGGPKFEYLWADGAAYRRPTALPAPRYVALLMDWTEAQINDEALFPVSTGKGMGQAAKVFSRTLGLRRHFYSKCCNRHERSLDT